MGTTLTRLRKECEAEICGGRVSSVFSTFSLFFRENLYLVPEKISLSLAAVVAAATSRTRSFLSFGFFKYKEIVIFHDTLFILSFFVLIREYNKRLSAKKS